MQFLDRLFRGERIKVDMAEKKSPGEKNCVACGGSGLSVEVPEASCKECNGTGKAK